MSNSKSLTKVSALFVVWAVVGAWGCENGSDIGGIGIEPKQAIFICDSYSVALNTVAAANERNILTQSQQDLVDQYKRPLDQFCLQDVAPTSVDAVGLIQSNLQSLMGIAESILGEL